MARSLDIVLRYIRHEYNTKVGPSSLIDVNLQVVACVLNLFQQVILDFVENIVYLKKYVRILKAYNYSILFVMAISLVRYIRMRNVHFKEAFRTSLQSICF